MLQLRPASKRPRTAPTGDDIKQSITADEREEAAQTDMQVAPLLISDQACRLCKALLNSVEKGFGEQSGRETIGVYQDLVRNKACPTCRHWMRLVEHQPWSLASDTPIQVRLSAERGVYIFLGTSSYILRLIVRDTESVDCVCVDTTDTQIDPLVIKQWIHTCDRDHYRKCHSFEDPWSKFDAVEQLMLLDVQDRCLVQQPGSCTYIALSYVWETTTNPFQTTLHNVQELSQYGAFDTLINQSRLPPTILDSMSLTKALGYRYLWIDRLCIIQDDHAHKRTQLRAMASIYANACFTIAACGDFSTQYGLLGIDPERPRPIPFPIIQLSPTCRLMPSKPHELILHEHYPTLKYHTRGWTFQEWALSPRILAFHHHTVSWLCRENCWAEIGTNQVPESMKMSRNCAPLSRWPNLANYFSMVSSYSERTLSYPEDTLEAFSSMIAAMGRSMDGGILHGLPEMCFDSALLWSVYKAKRKTDAAGKILTRFPSWSWLGWDGPIFTDFCANIHLNDTKDDHPAWVIRPVVSWFKIETHASESMRHLIKNTYHTSRLESGLDPCDTAPHSGTNLRSFVPLVEHPVPQDNERWSSIIQCRTRRWHVRIARSSEVFSRGTGEPIIDNNETIIGYVDICRHERSLSDLNFQYEVICISGMRCRRRGACLSLPEMTYLHRNCGELCRGSLTIDDCLLGPNWEYDCYNVLLIEWENGIAYRKALGRVFREVWDAAETEEIVVNLG